MEHSWNIHGNPKSSTPSLRNYPLRLYMLFLQEYSSITATTIIFDDKIRNSKMATNYLSTKSFVLRGTRKNKGKRFIQSDQKKLRSLINWINCTKAEKDGDHRQMRVIWHLSLTPNYNWLYTDTLKHWYTDTPKHWYTDTLYFCWHLIG